MKTEDLLEERGSRYGSWDTNAAIAQALKDVMYSAPSWNDLYPYQKEALEMIQHKISRMLNGDVTYLDNIEDLIGYATLMLEEMKKSIENERTPNLFEGDDDVS